jgi:hypothetical protein
MDGRCVVQIISYKVRKASLFAKAYKSFIQAFGAIRITKRTVSLKRSLCYILLISILIILVQQYGVAIDDNGRITIMSHLAPCLVLFCLLRLQSNRINAFFSRSWDTYMPLYIIGTMLLWTVVCIISYMERFKDDLLDTPEAVRYSLVFY